MDIKWKNCLKIGAIVFALYLAVTYWPSFSGFAGKFIGAAVPLLVSCVIAYVINILMSFYEKHYFPKSVKKGIIKSRRPVCMLGAFISLAIAAFFLAKMIVPELWACVELLIEQVPKAISSLVGFLESMNIVPEKVLSSLQNIDWKSKIEQIVSFLPAGMGSVMGKAINLVSSVFSRIVTAIFAFIFSIYLLSGKEKLQNQFERVMKRYIKPCACEKIKYLLCVINDCFHKYIVGQCAEAVILGFLCTAGMLLLGFPYATMTGAVIAFTALIPVAGGYIGAAVGAFMIMTVSPIKAILFLIYIVILQQFENNLIYPKVVGSSMGLPAIWVLAAVTIGGGVMGIPGMIIGVPLAAAFYRILREDVNRIPQENLSFGEKTNGTVF